MLLILHEKGVAKFAKKLFVKRNFVLIGLASWRAVILKIQVSYN